MLKTAYFFFIFWLGLMLSLFLLAVYYVLKISGLKETEKRYVQYITSRWAQFTLFTVGIKISVSGKENIPPSHSGFVVISNHQGNFDIPVFVACLPFASGFVAKKELMKLPFINSWMKAMYCLPIDRANARESREKLLKRMRLDELTPMFLFPEGTRSKGPKMGPFRTGTLKLLFNDRMDVLPVTINGSYKCYEEKNNVRSADVKVIFHPVLKTSAFQPDEFDKFNAKLREIIAGPIQAQVDLV